MKRVERVTRISCQHDRYDAVPLKLRGPKHLGAVAGGKRLLPPLSGLAVNASKDSSASKSIPIVAGALPTALRHLRHRNHVPQVSGDDKGSAVALWCCTLPLPEELLGMEDAPPDVFRSIMEVREERSAMAAHLKTTNEATLATRAC